MAASISPADVKRDLDDRETQIQLAALIRGALSKAGTDWCAVDDGDDQFLVVRQRGPVRVQNWSDFYPPEYAAEMQRRAESNEPGRLICDLTMTDDELGEHPIS